MSPGCFPLRPVSSRDCHPTDEGMSHGSAPPRCPPRPALAGAKPRLHPGRHHDPGAVYRRDHRLVQRGQLGAARAAGACRGAERAGPDLHLGLQWSALRRLLVARPRGVPRAGAGARGRRRDLAGDRQPGLGPRAASSGPRLRVVLTALPGRSGTAAGRGTRWGTGVSGFRTCPAISAFPDTCR